MTVNNPFIRYDWPQIRIPLISDTQSKPSPAMRIAIAEAEVGDEQKGDDPTVAALLERSAELLGKEAALFFPSGTMCNLIAIKVHTQVGDLVLAEQMAHIIRAESAGTPLCSGVLFEPIPSDRGVFTADQLEAALQRAATVPAPYSPPARLVCVEQTHNFGGGAVWPIRQLHAIHARSRFLDLKVHMDGARLLNAVVATGVSAAEYASCADSVWLDFTKGLGAPIGAVLAGSKEFIVQARRYKQVFGGAMRQAGIAAAGCLYALDHNVERLAEDHQNAERLSQGLATIAGVRVRSTTPETNMVFFDTTEAGLTHAKVLQLAEERGISMGLVGDEIRLVTHIDVSRADVDETISVVKEILATA